MHIIQERVAYLPHSTIGKVWIGDEMFWTVEKEFRNNQPNVSCVPDGVYKLFPDMSPKSTVPGGRTWAMENPELNVYQYKEDRKKDSDRFQCLWVHVGNYPRDFMGCCGAGMELGATDTIYDGKEKIWVNGVLKSKIAVLRIYELLKVGTEHTLEIIRSEGAVL